MTQGPKLTEAQLDRYRNRLVPEGVPVRFLYRGQSISPYSGKMLPKGINVIYQHVFWNLTKADSKEIAKIIGARPIFDKGE